MAINRMARLTIGLAAAVLFLWLVLREVKFSDVARVLQGARFGWVFIATFFFALDYACRIERWRLMLAHENSNERWLTCAGPFLASFAANNVLPLRAGDVLRIFSFNGRLGVGSGVIAPTLFVERMLDMLMVLCVLATALAFFDLSAFKYVGFSSVGLVCFAVAVVLVLLFSHRLEPGLLMLADAISRIWPRVGSKIRVEIEKSLVTLKILSQGSTMLKLLSWSVVAWSLETMVYVFSALALPAVTAPHGGYLALPLTAFATLIPSAPGYLGTFDFFAVRAMTGAGNSVAAAAAYAILVHVIIWLPITVVGGACWLRSSKK